MKETRSRISMGKRASKIVKVLLIVKSKSSVLRKRFSIWMLYGNKALGNKKGKNGI